MMLRHISYRIVAHLVYTTVSV